MAQISASYTKDLNIGTTNCEYHLQSAKETDHIPISLKRISDSNTNAEISSFLSLRTFFKK